MTPPSSGRPAALLGGLFAAALLLAVLTSAPARAQTTAAPARAFADALSLYQERLYGPAQEEFADFHEQFPEHERAPEALFYEARALLALEHGAAAARRLERLESDYPAHPLARRAQLRLGRYFFERGEDEQARRTLRRVLGGTADAERAAEARLLLGALERRAGRPDEALAQFRVVTEQFAATTAAPQALYRAASVHLEQGRTARAAEALERLARRYPEAPQASSLGLSLAEVYFDLERYDAVLDELDRRRDALRTETDRARAAFLRAEALRRQPGRLADAAEAYRRYLDRYAGRSVAADLRGARYGLALTRYRQEDYFRAADLFARVAAGDLADATAERAAFFAAASRAEAGEPRAAADAFAEFLNRFPESTRRAEARFRRGRALLDANRPAEAAHVLGRLAETPAFERRAEALYLRSRALAASGEADDDAALGALDAALTAGLPSALQAQAAFERARLLLRAGRPAEAADAFAAFRRRVPGEARAEAALYWEAESRYRADALPQAAAGYQRYLRQQPDGPYAAAAQYGLGWASFQQENYAAAARAFERFLEGPAARQNDTYRNDALLRLGDSYYARRRFAEAERAYARARSEGTREAQDYALYQTGQARTQAGDAAGAIDAWQELVRDFPQSDLREEARFQIGQSHFQAERYDEAVRAWRTLLQAAPDEALAARAQYSIGDALYNAGRPAEAARAYRVVLQRYPDSPFASDAASGVQYALDAGATASGSAPDADAFADSLEAADPEAAAELRFRQAETQYQRGQTDAARRAFQRFVRTSTREDLLPQAYYYLGALYADAGQYREAEGYLRQVLRDYPDSDRRADAARRLGALLLANDEPRRALDVFGQLGDLAVNAPSTAERRRTQARARYGQGRALAALGRTGEAEARLRDATDRAPAGAPVAAEARVALARLYENTERPAEARTFYRRVAEESRGAAGAEALYRLGALLLAEDRPADAIEELRRVPDLFPGFPEWIAPSLLAQARALRALGRTGQASQLYDRLQADFPSTPQAETARREQDAL